MVEGGVHGPRFLGLTIYNQADLQQSLHNLAILVWIQGDIDAARRLLEQSLEVRREAVGERDPLVARSMDFLGVLLYVTGNPEAGTESMDRALALRLRRCRHPTRMSVIPMPASAAYE